MKKNIFLKSLSETLKMPLLEMQKFDPNAPLTEIGMTSLSFISFIVKLEEETSTYLS